GLACSGRGRGRLAWERLAWRHLRWRRGRLGLAYDRLPIRAKDNGRTRLRHSRYLGRAAWRWTGTRGSWVRLVILGNCRLRGLGRLYTQIEVRRLRSRRAF